jgi:hypothetical protein
VRSAQVSKLRSSRVSTRSLGVERSQCGYGGNAQGRGGRQGKEGVGRGEGDSRVPDHRSVLDSDVLPGGEDLSHGVNSLSERGLGSEDGSITLEKGGGVSAASKGRRG